MLPFDMLNTTLWKIITVINMRENGTCSLYIVSERSNASSLFKISSEIMLTQIMPIIQITYTRRVADTLDGSGYHFPVQNVRI